MLQLSNKTLFASGGDRNCYLHPDDSNKLIKILHPNKTNSTQNDLEYNYYKYLQNRKVDFKHIAKCYGWIDTNLGKGLVFEKILNYDNSNAKEIRHYIKNKIFSESQENDLLNALKTYLEKNKILFIDVTTVNVLCKKIAKDKYKLVIIDGLGGKKTGLKSNLYLKPFFLPYTTYKIKKQWRKFLNNIKKVKNSI